MLDETAGWALGKDSVLQTVDGGKQWVDVTPPGGRAAGRDTAGEFLDADHSLGGGNQR